MKKLILAAILLLCSVAASNAAVLTFEGLGQQESVLNYYNGGLGGNGSGPGTNYGITFSSNALALQSGNFSNNPSVPTILFFLSGNAATMNVAAGFDTGFSFFYAASQAGSINVYDGLNGTGNILASLTLPGTASPYSVWNPIGVSFAGIAKSVDFGGAADLIGFDDITVGSATPGNNPVPEPGTIMLLGAGFLGLAVYGKRRKNA
jgi:hypothetical protein